MDQYRGLHIALIEGNLKFDLTSFTVVEIHFIGLVANFAPGSVGGGSIREVRFVDCFKLDEIVGLVA